MQPMRKWKWVALFGAMLVLLLSAGIAVATTMPQSDVAPAAQTTRTPTRTPTQHQRHSRTNTHTENRPHHRRDSQRPQRPGTTTAIVGKLKEETGADHRTAPRLVPDRLSERLGTRAAGSARSRRRLGIPLTATPKARRRSRAGDRRLMMHPMSRGDGTARIRLAAGIGFSTSS